MTTPLPVRMRGYLPCYCPADRQRCDVPSCPREIGPGARCERGKHLFKTYGDRSCVYGCDVRSTNGGCPLADQHSSERGPCPECPWTPPNEKAGGRDSCQSQQEDHDETATNDSPPSREVER